MAHNRLPAIHKKTGADLEDIREALEVIRHLNPKPGNQFSAEGTRYVTPDVIVEKNEDGGYDIRLTDDWAPRLNIPKQLLPDVQEPGRRPADARVPEEEAAVGGVAAATRSSSGATRWRE